MKYLGNLDKLKALIDTLPINGKWKLEPSGVVMFRCSTGAIMHFSTTTHAVWFNGNAEATSHLQGLIVAALQDLAAREKLMIERRSSLPVKEARSLGRGRSVRKVVRRK